jgi:1-acyl-sn-glycerol-3-phosphate acyltransferase
VAYMAIRRVVGVAFHLLWRPKITGLEHVPATGPVILASNHLSFIDSFVIPLAVPRKVTFLAKREYFEGTGVRGAASRMFFRSIAAVPVHRGGTGRDAMDALETAQEVLESGGAFGIYPEGTRSMDGRLYRGRTGVGWLALATQAPVVPVALAGTDRVQPVGARLPRIHRVRVMFAPPVDPAPFVARVEASGGAGRARREITDQVMDAIAAMSGQQRADGYNASPPGDDPVIG